MAGSWVVEGRPSDEQILAHALRHGNPLALRLDSLNQVQGWINQPPSALRLRGAFFGSGSPVPGLNGGRLWVWWIVVVTPSRRPLGAALIAAQTAGWSIHKTGMGSGRAPLWVIMPLPVSSAASSPDALVCVPVVPPGWA